MFENWEKFVADTLLMLENEKRDKGPALRCDQGPTKQRNKSQHRHREVTQHNDRNRKRGKTSLQKRVAAKESRKDKAV